MARRGAGGRAPDRRAVGACGAYPMARTVLRLRIPLVAGRDIGISDRGHLGERFAATETLSGAGERSSAGDAHIYPDGPAGGDEAIGAPARAGLAAPSDRLYPPRNPSVVRFFCDQRLRRAADRALCVLCGLVVLQRLCRVFFDRTSFRRRVMRASPFQASPP